MSKRLQKTISVFTSITTVLWLSGIAMLVPVQLNAATIVDGDLIRNPNAEGLAQFDIYIAKLVGDKKFKRLILSPSVFESYGHFDKNADGDKGWNDVVDVDQATIDSYTTSDLVRADGDTKVYKLIADGDTGTKQWLNMTADEFVSEGYDWDSIYTINTVDRDAYTAGSDITTEEEVVSEGTLSVALAADTPAAAIVVTNAARAPFTKINLTAAGADVVVDSMTLQRTGTAAQDGAFSSITVILDSEDGDQLGTNKTLNASHQTVVYDDITVTAGTTKSIYLVGNMGTISTTYAGEVPTLSLVAMTLKGTATLNATLPITGNAMTLNGTVTIGTATIVAGGNAPSASTQNVGITKYTVSAIKITAGSAEKLDVKKITWTQDGSADSADVQNVDLINANTSEVIATIAQPTSKTIVFTPNITIDKGKNISFDLRLDIAGGSGRTISYDIDQDTDILVKGVTYGYYVTPSYTGVSARPYYPAADTTIGNGSLRIESVAVSPTNIAENTANLTLGKFKFVAKGEEIKITSIGWNTRVTIGTTAGATTSDITNITVYDQNNTVVAGPMDPTYDSGSSSGVNTYGSATTTDTIVVSVGETTYTVKGDLSADFAANDIVQIRLLPTIITARGMTTDNSITPTPADWISSTALTIKAASLTITVSTDPAAQTVVAGTQDFIFAKYLFDATDSGSNIKVTQVKVPVTTSGSAYPDMVSGIELYDSGGNKISVDSDSTAYSTAGTTAAGSATTTLNITSGALVITAGTTKIITVKADVGTGVTSGTLAVGIQSDGVTATDAEGNSISETCTANQGQTMTLTSGGTLYLSALTDPSSAAVVAGSDGVSVGKFTLQAKYEGIDIDKVGITIAAPDGGVVGNKDEVVSLSLYEDGVTTAVGTADITADNATITPSTTLNIPINTTKNFTLKAKFAALTDTSPATSGSGVKFQITGLDATGTSAGSSSITKTGLDLTFNSFSVFKSLPTVTMISFAGADTITGNSVVNLLKFKISADSAGPMSLYKLTFGISTTTVNLCNTATDITDTTGYYVYMSTSESSLGDILSKGGSTAKGDMQATLVGSTPNDVTLEAWFDVNDDSSTATSQEQIIINAGDTKYFTLRGTVRTGHDGTADNESVSTVFAGDPAFSGTSVVHADDVDATAQHDFIWGDLNATEYTTSTATNTAMFFNGFRVPGVPTTSSTPQTIGD